MRCCRFIVPVSWAGTVLLMQSSLVMDGSCGQLRPQKSRYGDRCSRPMSAYHHEESDKRRQQLVHVARFWAGCSQCGDHWHSNPGAGECLAEVSRLRKVVIKLAASVMWSNRKLAWMLSHWLSNVVQCVPQMLSWQVCSRRRALLVAENDTDLRATSVVPDHTLVGAREPSHGVMGLDLERRRGCTSSS